MTQLLLGENIIGLVLGFLGPGRRERQWAQRKNKSTTKAKLNIRLKIRKGFHFLYILLVNNLYI